MDANPYMSSRGGSRQKRARADACVGALDTAVTTHLLEQAAWRLITTQMLQKVNQLVMCDMVCVVQHLRPDIEDVHGTLTVLLPELHMCARAGTYGKHSNHLSRDVLNI